MAKQRFKGALNSATLPMISVLQTRTVVQPQLDINVRTPRNPNNTEGYTDYSIPQVLYVENAVPSGEGFTSVSFETEVLGVPGASSFDQAIILRDADENNFVLSPAGGLNYIYTKGGAWVSETPITIAPGSLITRAYVNGRTFVCYEGQGIYEYDTGTQTYIHRTITGLADADVRGIGSSSNYLLAFGKLVVNWSSLVDPLDFVPSLTTGAGNAIPQDVKGEITAVLGISGGYIVYTAKNAVAGVYTNNSRAPFTFKEVNNAGGIDTYEQVTSEQNAGPHFAWTTSGLQKITIQGAEPISAEVNDFLAGRMWESYDFATHELTQHYSSSPEFKVKLTYISSRWLIISYGTGSNFGLYNYALVYDTILKRYGKIKLDHVDAFFYPYPVGAEQLTYEELAGQSYADLQIGYNQLLGWSGENPLSKSAVAFLQADGTVRLMKMAYHKQQDTQSVVIFGKFQMVRASMMTMQQFDLESVAPRSSYPEPEYKVYVATSYKGYAIDKVEEMRLLSYVPGHGRYAKRSAGLNFNVIVEGTFSLTAYMMEVTLDGDR